VKEKSRSQEIVKFPDFFFAIKNQDATRLQKQMITFAAKKQKHTKQIKKTKTL